MPIKVTGTADASISGPALEMVEALQAALGGPDRRWSLTFEHTPPSTTSVSLTSPDIPKLLIHRRIVNGTRKQAIDHRLFTLPPELQGRGLSNVVLDFSRKVSENLSLATIELHANLDVGGYAWLRRGFFPTHNLGGATSALLSAAGGQGYEELRAAVTGMTDAQVRAYVLTPEFSRHKPAFLGSDWRGSADLTDPAVRAALFKSSQPTPAVRGARGSLLDSSIRHQVMLERLKMAEARDYNNLLAMLKGQVDAVLARLRSSGTALSSLTRGRLNGLLRELDGAQTAALADAQDKLIQRLMMINEYETGFEYSSLSNVVPEGTTITAATAPAAWAAANVTPMSIGGDLLQPWIKEMTRAEVSMINKTILRGWSEGWTNDELEKILNGTKALNFKDGLLPKMAGHNSTIVRTAIQHVSSVARVETWKANSDIITKYRWVSTLDSRTSPQCRSLDGEEFEIGKGPLPPIHPNCRSTTVAVLKGKLAALSQGRTRASADGPVDANLSYYEWLKTQDAQFQEDVLGPARAKMFQSEGMTAEKFGRLQLGTAFQPLTLDELAALGY